jgi:hypothetical protein
MFPIGTEWSEYLISWHNLICFMYGINMRSDGREVSNMKMVVLSNILVWTLRKEVQTREFFWLTNCPLDHLSWHLYQTLREISCGGNNVSWWPFDKTIRVLSLCSCKIVLAECGRVMWGIRAAGRHGTMGRWLGEVGAMPQTAQFRLIGDWRRLSISFPLLSRPKLGRDSWHHVDTQNRDMECESCLICVLKE